MLYSRSSIFSEMAEASPTKHSLSRCNYNLYGFTPSQDIFQAINWDSRRQANDLRYIPRRESDYQLSYGHCPSEPDTYFLGFDKSFTLWMDERAELRTVIRNGMETFNWNWTPSIPTFILIQWCLVDCSKDRIYYLFQNCRFN